MFKKNKINNVLESSEKELDNNLREKFLNSIKNIENDETGLLKLQKQYRNGTITEKDLSKEQIDSLCKLYDKQILQLKKSNSILKSKLSKS